MTLEGQGQWPPFSKRADTGRVSQDACFQEMWWFQPKSVKSYHDIYDVPPVELNTYQARFFLSVRSENGSEYEPCALWGMLGSFIHHLNRKSYNVSLFDDVRFSSMRESLKSNQKQLKKIGKGSQPMRAELLTHTELDKLYKSQ